MTISRRKALILCLASFANLLITKSGAARVFETVLRYKSKILENTEENFLHKVQLSPCGGSQGYAGAEPSSIYFDIHTDLDPFFPLRDHRLAIPGTVTNQQNGARIIELHGWVRTVEKASPSFPNCSEDPADGKLDIEVDPAFADAKGIRLLDLMRPGSIVLHKENNDGYAAFSRPRVMLEIKSWHVDQRCDHCDKRLVGNPGWAVRPDDLARCPDGRELTWPWDPRFASNDPGHELHASIGDDADYVCVIGALVTDDPHGQKFPSLEAWTDSPQTLPELLS